MSPLGIFELLNDTSRFLINKGTLIKIYYWKWKCKRDRNREKKVNEILICEIITIGYN
jgi:hypothetical protein